MTSRQFRRERRAAERKSRKAELKRLKIADTEAGFVSQSPSLPRITDSHIPPKPTRAREQAVLDSGFVSQTAARSTKRAEINRANAEHSTGPTTPEGKLASSRNSLKHGLASGALIIPGEDRAAFDALLHDLLEDHQPANATESLLITEMAQSWWLAQRAIRLQNECFSENGVDEKRLSLFLRYQTTHERAFHKALNTLLRLKQSRAREQSISKVGFVSQAPPFPRITDSHVPPEPSRAREQAVAYSGFVSQNSFDPLLNDRFVPQNDPREHETIIQSLAEAA